MKFIGSKNDKDLYNNLIKKYLPLNLQDYTYVEPFGGSFGLTNLLNPRPNKLIYNDIHRYNIDLSSADTIHHYDYKKILDIYDDKKTIFYLDPPYYGKEHVYGMKKNYDEFHIELQESIKNRKGEIIISYEDCKFIRNLYKDYVIKRYNGNNLYKKKEILIII